MVIKTGKSLPALYVADEVAWLDAMAELIGGSQLRDLDYRHLKEYLEDMSKRDRREVEGRLQVLLMHVLKWKFQEKKRMKSWQRTISEQRRHLRGEFRASNTLRNHAEAVLADAYAEAVEWAAEESELPAKTFPPIAPGLWSNFCRRRCWRIKRVCASSESAAKNLSS
jgi:hypothetical protein